MNIQGILLVMLLVLALVPGLVACGGGEETTSPTPTFTEMPTDEPTAQPTATPRSTPSPTPETTPVPAPKPTPTPTPEPVTETWSVDNQMVRRDTTSTSSIVLANGMVRSYFLSMTGEIVFAESASGRDLSETTATNLRSQPNDLISNPAILQLDEGSFLMVFERMDGQSQQTSNRKLYAADSSDGITFENERVLPYSEVDRAPGGRIFQSVPDLLKMPDGSIQLYYVANGKSIARMTSTDEGTTWVQDSSLVLGNSAMEPDIAAYVDPDAVREEDGTITLYIAYSEFERSCGGLGCQIIRRAHAQPGEPFLLLEGAIIEPAAGAIGVVDPDVFPLADGTMVMLFGQSEPGYAYNLWYARLGRS